MSTENEMRVRTEALRLACGYSGSTDEVTVRAQAFYEFLASKPGVPAPHYYYQPVESNGIVITSEMMKAGAHAAFRSGANNCEDLAKGVFLAMIRAQRSNTVS